MGKYLDRTKAGYLSPEIQIRNLKLFGVNTSEKRYREEHTHYMNYQRYLWKQKTEAYAAKKAASQNNRNSVNVLK